MDNNDVCLTNFTACLLSYVKFSSLRKFITIKNFLIFSIKCDIDNEKSSLQSDRSKEEPNFGRPYIVIKHVVGTYIRHKAE